MYEKCSVGKTGRALHAQPGGISDPAEPQDPGRPDGVPESLRPQKSQDRRTGFALTAVASLRVIMPV